VWSSLGDFDLRPRLHEYSSLVPRPPSLVLHGTFDPIPIEASRELAGLLHAEMVELPVGHCPHVEATEEFVAALDGFLPGAQ
jgi:pimeloyl-ACP methyl ester carboxylesterase